MKPDDSETPGGDQNTLPNMTFSPSATAACAEMINDSNAAI